MTNPQIGPWRLQLSADTGNVADVRVSIDVFKKAVVTPTVPPLVPKRDGRARDACFEVYGSGAMRSKKVFGGSETNFDRDASLYQVCAGFGSPEDFTWSTSTKCAFISAATVLAGGKLADPALRSFDLLCSTAEVTTALAAGDYGGLAKDEACELFGSLFATTTGLVAVGARRGGGQPVGIPELRGRVEARMLRPLDGCRELRPEAAGRPRGQHRAGHRLARQVSAIPDAVRADLLERRRLRLSPCGRLQPSSLSPGNAVRSAFLGS